MSKGFWGALACAGVLSVSASLAQPYPTRTVTLIVPYGAGGPLDTLTRIVSERMRVSLGQPIVIDNITGASGIIGVGRAARAEPDGYSELPSCGIDNPLNSRLFVASAGAVTGYDPD